MLTVFDGWSDAAVPALSVTQLNGNILLPAARASSPTRTTQVIPVYRIVSSTGTQSTPIGVDASSTYNAVLGTFR